MTCREETLIAVKRVASKKGENRFTISEIIEEMKLNKTIYKESTIRTHICSKCCKNAPDNHREKFDDYLRIDKGMYKLII